MNAVREKIERKGEERSMEKREKERVTDTEEKARAKHILEIAGTMSDLFQRMVKP